MGPYKLLQPPRRWPRPHEPTSIMANVQRKMKKKYEGMVTTLWLSYFNSQLT